MLKCIFLNTFFCRFLIEGKCSLPFGVVSMFSSNMPNSFLIDIADFLVNNGMYICVGSFRLTFCSMKGPNHGWHNCNYFVSCMICETLVGLILSLWKTWWDARSSCMPKIISFLKKKRKYWHKVQLQVHTLAISITKKPHISRR